MMAPDPQLAAEFDRLAPWIFQFEIGGARYGGEHEIADERLEQFWRFAPDSQRILELGSLEGAHTVQLAAQSNVTEVVAIEGRAQNIAKAELVKRSLGVENARFVEANLENVDLTTFGTFDAVFCVGLLYHLPEPWKLIEQLPRVAPRLFLWTQYADEMAANEITHGCRGQLHLEGGPDEPLSGMSDSAFWLSLGSLLRLLALNGYSKIEIVKNDLTHPHGTAVTLAASTGAPI